MLYQWFMMYVSMFVELVKYKYKFTCLVSTDNSVLILIPQYTGNHYLATLHAARLKQC